MADAATTKRADNYERHDNLFKPVPVPLHIPPDLVCDFDYLNPRGMAEGEDVYTAWKRLHSGPPLIWTPHNGGHWIVTRGQDVKFVQENYQIFSHEIFNIPRGSVEVKMPPLTVDPPLHARYRAIFNPAFAPSKIAVLREKAARLTRDLVLALQPRGKCEFVREFSRIMPVAMFLGIVDLPLERREEFVDWGTRFMSAAPADRLEALEKVTAYLNQQIDARADDPGDDLLSSIAQWRQNPRFQGENEVTGMALLIFFGGLDTVAYMLSFTTWYLARHPELRRRLIEQPDIIPQAAEECFRRFGLSNTGRLILHDFEFNGVTLRKDEMIMVPIALSGMDDRLYENPLELDFDRGTGPADHNTFGNGPHKCVGAPLARAELQVFLEEWLKVIPDFRLDPEHPPVTHAGAVNGMKTLHLLWDV